MVNNTAKKTDKELANDKAQRVMNGVNIWCSYYRANPHRFCADYLNINLKLLREQLSRILKGENGILENLKMEKQQFL